MDSFNDLYATDSAIYGAFGGKVNLKQNHEKPSSERERLCTDIVMFDWEGKALRRINTDYRIERLCVDESENAVYAALMNKAGSIYLGRIKL